MKAKSKSKRAARRVSHTSIAPVAPVISKNVVWVIACRINIARPICSALFGKRHTPAHRMAAGTVIMIIGVFVAKSAISFPDMILSNLLDAIGYGLHGLGLTPFIEHLADKFRN